MLRVLELSFAVVYETKILKSVDQTCCLRDPTMDADFGTFIHLWVPLFTLLVAFIQLWNTISSLHQIFYHAEWASHMHGLSQSEIKILEAFNKRFYFLNCDTY